VADEGGCKGGAECSSYSSFGRGQLGGRYWDYCRNHLADSYALIELLNSIERKKDD